MLLRKRTSHGQVAELVYEAVEKNPGTPNTAGITRKTKFSPQQHPKRTGNAQCLERWSAHRQQRAQWHAWLDIRANTFITLALITDDYSYSDEDIPFWLGYEREDATLAALARARSA